jgi:hypothetical protein
MRGYVLVIVAVVGLVVWLLRGGRPSSWSLVFIAAAMTFWVMAGASYIPGREPIASRYQFVDAALLIVIAAELLRPVRLRSWQAAIVTAVALGALASNLTVFADGLRFMRDHATNAKVDLGAPEITRGLSSPTFQLVPQIAHDPYLTGVTARRYFDAVDGTARRRSPRPSKSPR